MMKLLKPNRAAVLLLLVCWLAFFAPVLFGQRVYFLDDLKVIYYPLEVAYVQFQNEWRLPQWSPTFGFGQPLMAWGQLGFFTPLHVLLRFLHLHPLNLLHVSIVSYFALGLGGMFAWLRGRQLSSFAAALGAVTFVFSGFSISHLYHVNFYTATMLLPWLLFSIDLLFGKKTLPATGFVSLVAAAIIMSGQPQIVLYTLLIGALYGLCSLRDPKHLGLALVAAVLALGLSSLTLLPLAEFLPLTERGADLPTTELYEFSYPPAHLVTLVFPFYYGRGETYVGAKNFTELSGYVGIIPVLLAGVGLLARHRWPKERWLSLLLLFFFLVLGFGRYSPVYRYLVEAHLLANLAVPSRFIYFLVVGVALLAAIGYDHLRARLPVYWKNMLPVLVVVSSVVAVAYGWQYVPTTPRSVAFTPSPLLTRLSAYNREHPTPARLYSRDAWAIKPRPKAALVDNQPDAAIVARHLNVLAGASSARWIGALSIRPYREFIETFLANDQEEVFDGDGRHFLETRRTLFNLAGVTHLAQSFDATLEAHDLLPELGFPVVAQVREGRQFIRLYENPHAFPKAFVVAKGKFSAAADDTRTKMLDPAFDPANVVYIDGPTPPPFTPTVNTKIFTGSAAIVRYEPTRVDVATESSRLAWLVVTDATTPQWQTYIDDIPAPYYTADTMFKAAQVPPGKHLVSFRYESRAIEQAKWLTGGSLVVLIFLLIFPIKKSGNNTEILEYLKWI